MAMPVIVRVRCVNGPPFVVLNIVKDGKDPTDLRIEGTEDTAPFEGKVESLTIECGSSTDGSQ